MVAPQAALLLQLLEAVEADRRIHAFRVRGSIARGTADKYSDLDTRIWISDDQYEATLADLPTLVRSIGRALDILFETPGSPYLFAQFVDGVQLELSSGRASEASGRDHGVVVLLDRDGLWDELYEPAQAWDRHVLARLGVDGPVGYRQVPPTRRNVGRSSPGDGATFRILVYPELAAAILAAGWRARRGLARVKGTLRRSYHARSSSLRAGPLETPRAAAPASRLPKLSGRRPSGYRYDVAGSAQARFQRAIERGHVFAADLAARELGTLSLSDALALCLLYERRTRQSQYATFIDYRVKRP